MSSRMYKAAVVFWVVLAGSTGAYADGVVKNASQDAAKGIVQGVKEEVGKTDVNKGAKDVGKGFTTGAADAVPALTNQMIKQAKQDRKAIGQVARTMTTQAVAGVVDVTNQNLLEQLGKDGDGPMANAMVGMAERVSAAIVRGASSEMHFKVSYPPVWPLALAFVIGGFSTLVFGIGLMLLYILFQRKRVVVAEPTPAVTMVRPQLARAAT